jgi:Ca-activated chloride channel homolog
MEFTSFTPLWLLVIFGGLWYVFKNSLVDREQHKKEISFFLRALSLLLIIVALCEPYLNKKIDSRHVIYMLDFSESIDYNDLDKLLTEMNQSIDALNSGDTWGIYAFGETVLNLEREKLKETIKRWNDGLGDKILSSKSELPNALTTASFTFPSDKVKEICVFSDGRSTQSGLDKTIHKLKEEAINVYFREVKSINKAEASVISLDSKVKKAFLGEIIQLKAKLSSNRKMKAKLKFLSQNIVIATKEINLEVGHNNEYYFESTIHEEGRNTYSVELEAAEDYFTVNNKADYSIQVKGSAKVLAIHQKPEKLRSLKRALNKQGINLEVRGKRGMPSNLDQLLEFDALIIANISATDLSQKQMLNIKTYVTDFGGGLMMMGSENSFGLGGYFRSPVEEVLPLISRYEKEKEKPSLALALVIDKSGSMNGLPIEMARMAAIAAVDLLGIRDYVCVVAFDGQARAVTEMVSASNKSEIIGSIESIPASGGTNMYPAMELAKEMLQGSSAKLKHMILLGDGMSSPGPFEDLASEAANERISISSVALGQGADRGLMQSIAKIGKGRYYETMDAETVPRIFAKETMEASRSSIKEEPFSPISLKQDNFLEGIDIENSPFLLAYVMTKPKPTAKVLLMTESGDPLMASGQYGLGKSLAFTSDATDEWGGEWLDWRDYGKFWAQCLRSIIRKSDDAGMEVKMNIVDNQRVYGIRYRDKNGVPMPSVKWRAVFSAEHGEKEFLKVKEIGLGYYEVKVPILKTQKTTLLINDSGNDKSKIISSDVGYPNEYRLEAKADKGVDSMIKFADLEKDQSKVIYGKIPMTNPLLLISLALMFFGILFRRI